MQWLSTKQQEYIGALVDFFEHPTLPGWKAQQLMSPIKHTIHPTAPDNVKKAGVMLLLRPNDNDSFSMVYIKRGSKYGQDKHKGQVGFAGGKKEDDDKDMLACALRETEEEIGINRGEIKVLGALSTFYIFISGFVAYPYVGIIPAGSQYVPDPDEVAYVIECDVNDIFNPDNLRYREHKFKEQIIQHSPYYHLNDDDKLWGATAMMTSEFHQILISLGLH